MPDPSLVSDTEMMLSGAPEPESPRPLEAAAELDSAPAEAPVEPAAVEASGAAEISAVEPAGPPVEPVRSELEPVSEAAEPAPEPETPASSAGTTVIVATSAAAASEGQGAAAAAGGAVASVPSGSRAAAGFQLTDQVGLSLPAYQPGPELPADRGLVRLLVPEKRLTGLWDEIDQLETEAAGLHRGSQKLVTELLTRLTSARNMLLHHRDQFENAQREVAYVRYRLVRIRHSSLLEQPQAILAYLVLALLVVAIGFVAAPRLLALIGNPAEIAGIASPTLMNTLFWGGVGGLTAAYFALQRHVEDFDQQHARWYYLSPVVGLFVGPLMALVANIGLPAFFALVSSDAGEMAVAPALLYLLAWAVGFQQNLLLKIVTSVFQRIFPKEAEA